VPDIDRTDYLLIVGANPAISQDSLMTMPGAPARLKGVVARGGKVVVIDPRRTETAKLASEHHFIRPGTDAAFLLAIVRTLFAEGRVWLGAADDLVEGLAARAQWACQRISRRLRQQQAAEEFAHPWAAFRPRDVRRHHVFTKAYTSGLWSCTCESASPPCSHCLRSSSPALPGRLAGVRRVPWPAARSGPAPAPSSAISSTIVPQPERRSAGRRAQWAAR
jgi:hypothetical protein